MGNKTLDCRGLHCPLPIVNLANRMKDADLEDEIEFFADDLSCVTDLPAWCSITGNQLISLENDGAEVRAVIKRGA